MKKVKTSRNLKTRIATSREAMDRKIPAPTSRNIYHGHLILGMRSVNHIEYEPWEQDVDEYLRVLDKGRLDRANRYYNAMNDVQKLLMEGKRRSEELQVAYEEMQSTNEEMQSTNEELQSTTDELERASAYRQTMMDSMLDVLMTTDTEGTITEVNSATERISGYPADELLGKPFSMFFTESDRAQAGIEQVIQRETVSDYELTVVTKDGQQVPVSYNATALRDPDGRITGVLGSARDITEIKAAEAALAASKAHAESITRNFLDTLIVVDTEAKIQTVNPATCELLGYTEEELIGQPISIIFAEEEEEEEVHRFFQFFREPEKAEALRPKDTIRNRELTYKTKGGQLIPMLFNASVVTDEAGNVTHVVAGAKDITELKLADAEIRREKRFSENIIATVPESLLVLDADLRIKSANRSFYEKIQTEPEKVIDTRITEILGDEDGRLSTALTKLFGTEDMLENFELLYHSEKLGERIFNITARGMLVEEEGEEEEELVVIDDVTERKRKEEELQKLFRELKESQAKVIQAGKMTAMGTMTAGVAHELNNPMMGILNFIQYSLKHTSEDDRRYTVLQDAERETKRCVEIVQNLLTFSRMDNEGEEDYQKESCAAILDRVLKLLSYRIEREKVTLTQHTAKGTQDIRMKVNNIQQVFFNIVNNALDALKESEKKEIHVDMQREGEFVLVTIADSGCGIPPENLRKIFDPFFTTKPVGQATGLGLSICHSLLEAHGGEITCESEPGAGTKFKFSLPIGKAKEEEKKQND